MRNIKALKQRRAEAKAEGHALLAKIRDENRDPTAEEQEQLKKIAAELDQLDRDIQAAEALAELERRMQPDQNPLEARRVARITSDEPDPQKTGGFKSIAEFARAVQRATPGGGNIVVVDPRLMQYGAAPSDYHETSGSSGEGYLVPPQFRQQIWEVVYEQDDLLSVVDPEPTSSNLVTGLADETTPWGSKGVQAKWRSEGTQMQPSKTDLQGRTVHLHELFAFVVATDELLADGPRLQSRLTRAAGQAISWKASDTIMWGDGVGKPLGFMKSSAKVTVSKESGQASNTIVTANIAKMFARLLKTGLGRSFWIGNSDILPQLLELTIGSQPVWTPPQSGMQQAPGGFLLGRPIRWSEHAETLGTEGDLVLIDPSGYYATQKAGEGIRFDQSIHLYFDYGMTAFRWMFRLGGMPILSQPVSPARGSSTRSHFVTLQTRS